MAHPLILEVAAPLNSRGALDKRGLSLPVEEGAKGEVAGRFHCKEMCNI